MSKDLKLDLKVCPYCGTLPDVINWVSGKTTISCAPDKTDHPPLFTYHILRSTAGERWNELVRNEEAKRDLT